MSVGLVRGLYRIDIDRDELILVCEVPDHIPPGRKGKKVHRSAPFRWCADGRQAPDGEVVKLPSVTIGGLKYTSKQALRWWIDRLSGNDSPEEVETAGRAYARAERELDAAGVGV